MNYPAQIAAKRQELAHLRATRSSRHSRISAQFLRSIRRLSEIVESQPVLLKAREAKASARRFDSAPITGFDGLMEHAS